MNNKIKVSIIIIVKNDKGVLETVENLRHQISSTIEIIVVDASTVNIKPAITSNVRWIKFKVKNKLKKITIPEQRNLGVESARGEIIVFVDANCTASENWLSELISPILEGKENIVAGSIFAKGDNKYHNSKLNRLKMKRYLTEAPTMNLALKKKVFDIVGQFDESFEYGSDVDFTWRAINTGYRIRYNPNAILYHNWGKLDEEMKRAYKYGQARMNLYKKHKISLKHILKNEYVSIIYPVFWIFLPVAFFYPLYLLLLVIPVIKNYQTDPVKTIILNSVYGFGILKKLLLQ